MSSPPTATFSVSPLRTGAHIRSRRPLRCLPGVGGGRDAWGGPDDVASDVARSAVAPSPFLDRRDELTLVFAMSLLMSGLAESFTLETDRALDSIGADVWVVQEGASGPFTSFSPSPRPTPSEWPRSTASPPPTRSSMSIRRSATIRRTSTSSASSEAASASPSSPTAVPSRAQGGDRRPRGSASPSARRSR